MKKSIVILSAATLVLAACSPKASVEGLLEGAPDSELIVSKLNVNKLETIDTLKTDAQGKYSFKVDVKKGCPEFFYVYRGSQRIAPLLLERGKKVSVVSDTLGTFTIEGSEEAELYADVESEYNAFKNRLDSLALAGDVQGIRSEYISYYRSRIRFMAEHPYSMSLVPILYQNVTSDVPVFSQLSDALHFSQACDSLEMVYPDSRYVKALRKSAKEKMNYLEFSQKVDGAEAVAFPEIALPNINAENIKLSEVEGKIVMLYFWSLTPEQKLFNIDQLLPLYEEFHSRGFEIYSVALEADKTLWATTVKAQELPWINVCDVREEYSQYLSLYNVTSLPYAFFIKDGAMMNVSAQNAAEIKAMLSRELK